MHSLSIDSGERWLLAAADGKPVKGWDSRGTKAVRDYDQLRRPLTVSVTISGGSARIAEQVSYGEAVAGAQALNLRGAVYQQRDEAGIAATSQRDFQGNVTSASRQLLADYSGDVDWSPAPAPVLSPDVFATATTFDALNRPVTITAPDGSVTRPVFNERNLLAQVSAVLAGGASPVTYVSSVSYDPKGQRQLISYGNGATTSYAYDPDTLRLIQLQTTRPSAGNPLQSLTYTYDPVGNVTRIADAAQQAIFFANQVVTASADYTYDAIYRLVKATGREHIGQAGAPQTDWNDSVRIRVPLPADGQAMRNYTEAYSYDEVGNLTTVVHAAAGGNWTRGYSYGPGSPPAGNQLRSSTVGASTSSYSYDSDGNLTAMPQLHVMTWDWKNQLQATALAAAPEAAVPTTYYQYDSAGQRARKATANPAGALASERIYLGGYEVYREYSPAGALTLERQSLHIPDGTRLICLVETTTMDASATPGTLPKAVSRYQLGNLLGSAVLELDPAAAILTYEEYYPYGSTSFQTGASAAEVGLKRYHYTGRERDAETGLYYHAARYYAPWLGRWTSCDPLGTADGPSLYQYARCNPVRAVDRTGTQTEPMTAGDARAQLSADIETGARYEAAHPPNMRMTDDPPPEAKPGEAFPQLDKWQIPPPVGLSGLPPTEPPGYAPAPWVNGGSYGAPGGLGSIRPYPRVLEWQPLVITVDTSGSAAVSTGLSYRKLETRTVDVGGGFTWAEQGQLSAFSKNPGYNTGSFYLTGHSGTPGRNRYEPWGQVSGRGIGGYLQAGILTGQGPLQLKPPGSSSVPAGRGAA